VMRPLALEGNKIWSNELNCWLVAGHEWLWLEDGAGKVLLTEAEARGEQAKAERERAEAERERAEAEAQAREFERQRAEAEKKRAEAERERAERLAAKLRELNIDPDTL
jgi:hypothetical protein